DPHCACQVCATHSRGYLRHLFQSKEPTASRLLSLHNLKWTIDLVASMRSAIIDGTFESLREEILHTWA
ncbi:MAG: tRNA-guanine transglycosylase, partial [Actinomycetota bacterium]|nr:tRNA-guanine transglycosylase [Actinomycetota bacterium]